MVESFLSAVSEAYSTDTTEWPEGSQPSSLTASFATHSSSVSNLRLKALDYEAH
jgi:hypothetical protein